MDRVSDGERNAAITAVEAALTEGRIVQADRDRRVDQIRHAQTATELQMITQDLAHRGAAPAWTTYEPPRTGVSTEAPSAPPAPQVSYGPPQDQLVSAQVTQMYGSKPAGASKALILVPIIFFLVMAIGAGAVILSVIGNATDSSEETFEGFDPFDGFEEPGEAPPPDLFTPGGFQDLLGALRSQTGGTAVFEAVLYEEYAVTSAPAEPQGRRAISYYFDGELSESTKSTSPYDRFDLSTIDPAILARLVRKVRMLIEDPTSSYVIVRKPEQGSTTWLAAYASNEFGESGYLRAEKDGTVVDRSVS